MNLVKLHLFDAWSGLTENSIESDQPTIVLNPDRVQSIEPYSAMTLTESRPPKGYKSQIKMIDGPYYYSLSTPDEVYEEIKKQTQHERRH